MPSLAALLDFVVFVLELFLVGFGSLFLVLLFAEIMQQRAERGRGE